jgi:hypothetical protein
MLIVIIKVDDKVENFGAKNMTPSDYEEPEDLEPEVLIDREKMEKKMRTPVSSNTSTEIITPLFDDFVQIEPFASEPSTTESFLDYSYISGVNEEEK